MLKEDTISESNWKKAKKREYSYLEIEYIKKSNLVKKILLKTSQMKLIFIQLSNNKEGKARLYQNIWRQRVLYKTHMESVLLIKKAKWRRSWFRRRNFLEFCIFFKRQSRTRVHKWILGSAKYAHCAQPPHFQNSRMFMSRHFSLCIKVSHAGKVEIIFDFLNKRALSRNKAHSSQRTA